MNIMGQLGLAEEAANIFIGKAFGARQINAVAALNEEHALGDNLQALVLVQYYSILEGHAPAPQAQKHQVQAPAHQTQMASLLHIIPFIYKKAYDEQKRDAGNNLTCKISA